MLRRSASECDGCAVGWALTGQPRRAAPLGAGGSCSARLHLTPPCPHVALRPSPSLSLALVGVGVSLARGRDMGNETARRGGRMRRARGTDVAGRPHSLHASGIE
ncbi:unnamed protein product [Closterium sp. NIES-54]